MGFYMRYLRPGRIMEVSGIGVALLLLAIIGGGWIAESGAAETFTLSANQLTLAPGLRLRRLGAAGVDAARSARLPVGLHEDRRYRAARGVDLLAWPPIR